MSTSATPYLIQPSILAKPALSIGTPPKEGAGSNITFFSNQTEMLKVAEDGFYVRGKKLDIDDNEAKHVYLAFRQFLIWSALVKS